jgi:hypothetical protein
MSDRDSLSPKYPILQMLKSRLMRQTGNGNANNNMRPKPRPSRDLFVTEMPTAQEVA